MGYTVDNSITPMYGGTAIPITGQMPDWFYIDHKDTQQWWLGSMTTIRADKEYGDRQLNFYYKINSRNGDNTFVISTGVYVDITFDIEWYSITADFEPKYTWLQLDKQTYINIADVDSTQSISTSFSSAGSTVSTIGVPGILLSYELTPAPEDDWPDRHICTCTYRYWLASNFDFVLTAAAKLKVTNRIAVGSASTLSEPIYLHFDNVPYLSYPTEITDMEDFVIDYSFPNLTKLEYVKFSLLDDMDNPVIDYKEIPKTANNYTFSLTDDDKDRLYAKYNTVNDTPISFGVMFKNSGEAAMQMSYTIHLTIVKVNPTMFITLTDDKKIVPDTEEVFVNILSDLRVAVDPVAHKGAYIVNYGIEHNGQVYQNQAEAVFPSVTNQRVYVYCTDSRGNKTTKDLVLDGWIPYQTPVCSISAEAPNTDGELPVTLSGRYFGDYSTFDNEYYIYYKYISSNSDHSVENWTLLSNPPEITTSSSNSYRFTTSFELLVPNHSDTYTVQIQLRDKYRSYTSNSVTVKSIPVFDWGQNDFNFNVPVTIQGDLVVTGQIVNAQMAAAIDDTIPVDYVVQTGASGIWTYRLWNSGIAECWGRLLPTQYTINTAWGALYVKDNAILRQDYPFEFTELPVVSMSLYNTSGNCWAYTGTQGTTSQSPAFGLARGTSGSVTVGVELTAIGKWK